MNILLWILFGALAGWIASMLMKTDAEQGAIANIVTGILGALLGGWAWTMITGDRADSLVGQLLLAIIGAMVIIGAWRAISRRGHTQ